jgi:hypothetical protein
MSDQTLSHTARTSEVPSLERRTAEDHATPPRPTTLPEERKDAGATTGVMRIKVPAESVDKSAKRDADKPAGV